MPKQITPMGSRQFEIVTDDKKHVKHGQVKESDNFKNRELGTDVVDNLNKILTSETLRTSYLESNPYYDSNTLKACLRSKSGEAKKIAAATQQEGANEMWKKYNQMAGYPLPSSALPSEEAKVEKDDSSEEKVKDLIRSAIKFIEKKLEL